MRDLWLRCADCGTAELPTAWRCSDCGGVLELDDDSVRNAAALEAKEIGKAEALLAGSWRVPDWLPGDGLISLGEPATPLTTIVLAGHRVLVKNEGAMPTGSFEDRGAALMVTWLARHNVTHVVADSSGNAGASLAAYSARAGITCSVYAPRSASRTKVGQIRAYGATLHRVVGGRSAATAAAVHAASVGDAVYASHAWSPIFIEGTMSFAYELWEQLSHDAPDVVVVPVGTGTLLLGILRGFAALHAAGLIQAVPRVVGVQADGCAPLAEAWRLGRESAVPIRLRITAAEGIRVAQPPRGRQILREVEAVNGMIVAVEEAALWRAHAELGRMGLLVEPTSAVAFAGVRQLLASGVIAADDSVVVPITATGIKGATSGSRRIGTGLNARTPGWDSDRR